MIISVLDPKGGFFVAFKIMRVKFRNIIVLVAMCMPHCVVAGGYRAAMVADMDTGRVLYSENANDLNYPASLTKIMTMYLTFCLLYTSDAADEVLMV